MNPSMRQSSPVTVLKRESGTCRTTASDRIRRRLVESGRRFHANDNIADLIEDGELDELHGEVEDKMQAVLEALVIDTAHHHDTAETARRVARMYVDEVFRGRYQAKTQR